LTCVDQCHAIKCGRVVLGDLFLGDCVFHDVSLV
jgi:hypothetical protein